tara:strand:+ start:8503 stop:10299 length:1797 start_codon:yes stop_codon:yes gene_type:complete
MPSINTSNNSSNNTGVHSGAFLPRSPKEINWPQGDSVTVDFSRYKTLIIDDIQCYRFALKRIMEELGATDIDLASNGPKAIEMMAAHNYDLVLSDYNLGIGQSGQQILEEARHCGYAGYSTVYVMITAENEIHMVMSAIEYRPDSYIAKPFNTHFLRHRLSGVIERKRRFNEISVAVDQKDYDFALTQIGQIEVFDNGDKMELAKLETAAYMGMGDYLNAAKVFRDLLKEKFSPWAMLGLGRCHFYRANYNKALDAFKAIIDRQPMCVEANDWAARTLVEMEEPEQAINMLLKAVEVSPRHILRQQALAKLSIQEGDYEHAEKASKQAIKMGRHSCFQSAEDFITYARVLIKKASTGRGNIAAAKEAMDVLKEVRPLAKKDPETKIRLAAMKLMADNALGNVAHMPSELEHIRDMIEDLPDDASDDEICTMTRDFVDDGQDRFGMVLVKGIIHRFSDNMNDIVQELHDIFDGTNYEQEFCTIVKEEQEKLSDENQRGMELYHIGKYEQAMESFSAALQLLPDSIPIGLNYLQCVVVYLEQDLENEPLCRFGYQLQQYIADMIEYQQVHFERFPHLRKRMRNLARKYKKSWNKFGLNIA